MPNYRRAITPGGTLFFTVVTEGRKPLFASEQARTILGSCIREAQSRWPVAVDAIVLLPDHLHSIWSLPSGDTEYSVRWAWIKKEFTNRWLATGANESTISAARQEEGRRGVWQPRFWEHTIRDEEDFDRHFDYVHYNPVKHGHAKCPHAWESTSFHRWVAQGVYEKNWACSCQEPQQLNFNDLTDTVGE